MLFKGRTYVSHQHCGNSLEFVKKLKKIFGINMVCEYEGFCDYETGNIMMKCLYESKIRLKTRNTDCLIVVIDKETNLMNYWSSLEINESLQPFRSDTLLYKHRALICIIREDENKSYEWFFDNPYLYLNEYIVKNCFNIKKEYKNLNYDSSYVTFVKERDFMIFPEKIMEDAYDKSKSFDTYRIFYKQSYIDNFSTIKLREDLIANDQDWEEKYVKGTEFTKIDQPRKERSTKNKQMKI